MAVRLRICSFTPCQPVLDNKMVLDYTATDQVFLYNPFDNLRSASMVPRTFGVHHGDRTPLANPQTIGLGSQGTTLLGKLQLLEAPL